MARQETSNPHTRVAIVGAGFAGLGAAIRLKAGGEHDFVVLEKADEVGGCWRDNTYPGLQCDVQSVVYSYSFAPNPGWSRDFAWGPEIFAYLRDCADRFGVRPHLRLGTELSSARWDEAAQRWSLETSRGPRTAEVLISAHGALSAPAQPRIPGLERFKGPVFHSARWRHDVPLEGKRVAVIGTGASAIQIVPALQPKVARLDVYQRSPPWILPRPDRRIGPATQALYRRLPALQRAARALRFGLLELRLLGLLLRPELMGLARAAAARHLRAQVADPALRRRLTPDYAMGCKRILLSNDYYPALARPNAELVTAPLCEVTADAVVTEDGVARPVDAIVLCTGFSVAAHPVAARIHGRDGRTLAERWSGGASALLGLTVSGFPNLFLLLTGPHTGLGHNSIVYMIEAQLEHVVAALDAARRKGGAVLEVRAEAEARFTAEMRRRLDGTVWSSGCSSFYLDAAGRNVAVWPGFATEYRRRARRFDPAAYTFQPRGSAEVRP